MRYALTDREWNIIQPILPSKPRGISRVDDPADHKRHSVDSAIWCAVA